MNKMKEIKIEKLTLNMGTGKESKKLEKAMKLLQKISNLKPVQTKAKKRIPTWDLRPGVPIGAKVTIRKNTEELLKRLFHAVENKILLSKFDSSGNLSFGIAEYIDVPGLEYDPEIEIMGFEVAVTLKRPGFRIKNRKMKPKKIPKNHSISAQEAAEFIKDKFNVQIGE